MKRLLYLLFLIPIAVVIVTFAVANRAPVNVYWPDILDYPPIPVPLYILICGTLLVGMLIGSFITWCTQHKFRKLARVNKQEVKKVSAEAEKQKIRADELAAENAEELSSEEKAFSALGLPAPQKAI